MTIDAGRMTTAVSLDVRFPDFPEAECITADPEDFFPKSGGGYDIQVAWAKSICERCPHRTECLLWALEHEERGVWGATSDGERKSLKRGRSPITCTGCGVVFPDPGKQGRKPRRCPVCRGRGEG